MLMDTPRLFEPYHTYLQNTLLPSRYTHSVNVMRVMAQLALIYDLDPVKAMTIGLLHDIAHDLSPAEQLHLADSVPIPLQHTCEQHPLILHALVGAHLAAERLGVSDPVILNAIRCHGYCGSNPPLSERYTWCMRFADMLDPLRTWQDLTDQLAPPVFSGDLEQGARILVAWMVPFLENRGLPVHPNLYSLQRQLIN